MKFPSFKSKEEIPEAFASLYKEVDGEWVVPTEEPEVTKEDLAKVTDTLAKVREDLKEERDARKTAEKALAEKERADAAKGAGVDDSKLAELEEKIRADVLREVDAELQKKDARIAELEPYPDRVRGLLLDANVKTAMLEAGVRPDRVDALFRLTSDEYDLTDGEKPMLKNHPTKALKIFMEDNLKKQYPEFFKGTQAGGGGAGGFSTGGEVGGTTAEDILANPAAAATAARAAANR